jgi:outer membrane receptor protein involved in Fe transport
MAQTRFGQTAMPARSLPAPVLLPLALTAMLCPLSAHPDEPANLTATPLDDLVNMKVYGASKFSQRALEAPASVTVVSAADIRIYGYRNLADILRSIRGLYTTYDRNYYYLGVRGFGRPGDYGSRVLILVDGARINDNVYDSAAIGLDFPVDVDLIDRVEFVPGPGSSLYGSNAFFGVVNVVTKRGRDLQNVEMAGAAQSYGTDKERLSLGHRFDNGLDVLLSASRYSSNGQNFYYPQFDSPTTNNGRARGLDGEDNGNWFARLGYGGWSLEAIFNDRRKDVPTGEYDTLFGVPGTYSRDRRTYVNLEYQAPLPWRSEVLARLSYGQNLYDSQYRYTGYTNVDSARGQWLGGEVKLFSEEFEGHKLIGGGEFQINLRQDQGNFNRPANTFNLDERHSGDRYGFYLQDEMGLLEGLKFNGGLRYDHYSTFGGTVNPRLALIYQPWRDTAVKFTYGTAFRAPNEFELYYRADPPDGAKPNPDLNPERIETFELGIESQLAGWLLTGSLFRYELDQVIEQVRDPADQLLMFVNEGAARIDGVSTEAERVFESGVRLRTSYSFQYAEDLETDHWLTNSPKHLFNVNLSAPLYEDYLRLGWDSQYTSARKTLRGETGGYFLGNLTLTAQKFVPGLEVSASVYNLFDVRYRDPVGDFLRQDSIEQNGRNFRVKAILRF